MKIARDVLARFTDLPSDNRELRTLLDDVGVEVKRVDSATGPLCFTVELLANRGDHHCYEGIARELTGRTGLPLRRPTATHLHVASGGWPVLCRSDKVLVYTATILERGEQTSAFDDATMRPLQAAGIHAIHPAVDATNLVNLEIGQPTHVFDAAKVDGPIVLRESVASETAWPLFTEGPIPLPEGTLVVADSAKVLAIAGVIGCEDSKATEDSQRIIVESATFDPVAVRRASRALGIFTDSSARFERGGDPERALAGAGRVVHLLESVGWRRASGTTKVGDFTDPQRTITLSVPRANRFLGVELDAYEMQDRLERYGFVVAHDQDDSGEPVLRVRVPTWRLWDVEHVADLHEELAKSIGYNHTPITLPQAGLGALPSAAQRARRAVDDVLVGAGFYEVVTDGFYGRQVLELLGIDDPDHPLHAHVQTLNAVDRAYSWLKNNALGQAVLAVADNQAMRVRDVKIFEWTRTFHPSPTAPEPPETTRPPCTERPLLWALCCGDAAPHGWTERPLPADGHFLKGVLAELGTELALDLGTGPASDADPMAALLHPNRRASVLLDGRRVGVMGEVHPRILTKLKLGKARPWYLEISASALAAHGSRARFVEPPNTHPVERSLAFGLPAPVEADSVAAYLHACGPDWLERVTVEARFDTQDEHGRPIRAITYRLRFDNRAQDRSAEQVNAALEQLVQAVHEQFGGAGVTHR